MALKAGELRYWGFWTRGKLDILSRYLDAFTTAGKNKSKKFIYLDLFAGQTDNIERLSEKEFAGSTKIALEIGNPPFTRFRFFEKEHFEKLEESLSNYDNRDIKVIPGDCNENISEVLEGLSGCNRAPTFAFIDPNGPDCHWSTLEALARFGKPAKKYKTELWMLFADGMFTRLLPVKNQPSSDSKEKITKMFGTDEWRRIYSARCENKLEASEAREEYVNLMRWRLENKLGYKWTHPFAVFNESGSPLYHLIFATDNEAGNNIMTYLYKKALEEFPEMQKQAKALRKILEREKAGEQFLIDPREIPGAEPQPSDETYVYESPWKPYQPL